jgi:hypothetical protein
MAREGGGASVADGVHGRMEYEDREHEAGEASDRERKKARKEKGKQTRPTREQTY